MLNKRTVNGQETYDPSQLVPIPHQAPTQVGDNPALQPAQDGPYNVLPRTAPAAPQQPGVGRLKSIGG